ncbi:L,D-transpeptidase family protein [Actinoplanes sp. NPDC049316]|uniref:L,D-transpeptidase n=1 Tax=Actinoplanes sp. NPDC049316 TaxID=3154727 RepID=UPI00343E4AFE
MSGVGAIAGVLAALLGLGATAYAVDVPGAIQSQMAAATAEAPRPASSPSRKAAAPFIKVVGSKTTATDDGRTATQPSPAAAPCATTVRQREVEAALSSLEAYRDVTVDGRQSPGDCAVIRRFQQRFGIEPANGSADATTADVARRIATSSTPQHLQGCGAGPGITACVDLSLQTVWVLRDGKPVFGPTVVRTGFRGYATPAGTYKINKRELREWSDPYEVWLPYWQRFVGGIGFHESTTYIHDATLGSHGCVNLLRKDAIEMWNQLHMGATVRTFGRRAGT